MRRVRRFPHARRVVPPAAIWYHASVAPLPPLGGAFQDDPMPRELHYIGRQDHEPIDDARHFHICARCGQPVDKRDAGEVMRHEARGHAPPPLDASAAPPPPPTS